MTCSPSIKLAIQAHWLWLTLLIPASAQDNSPFTNHDSPLSSSHSALRTPHSALISHPRLYFSSADLPQLRRLRSSGTHKLIWRNLRDSADWCLTLTPRKAWIAP